MHRKRNVRRWEEDRQAQAERAVARRCLIYADIGDAVFVALLQADGEKTDELALQWHLALARLRDAEEEWESLHPFHMPAGCPTCRTAICPHWKSR